MREMKPLPADRGAVRGWLLLLALLVVGMTLVGGATRLTGSGLSITEWKPIHGAIPPLSEAEWQQEFTKYQQIPQYQQLNSGMSLRGFKGIYWWEWSHRLLGRGIGLAFALPFLWFLARGRLGTGLAVKLLGIGALGGLQGLVGWIMVQSGLTDRTSVDQVKLAMHLGLSTLILGLLLWTALGLAGGNGRPARLATITAGQRRTAGLLVGLVYLQVLAGALVAGMKAGLSHNTWPLMDGHIVPPGLLVMQPAISNLLHNAMTVQFDHRLLAYAIAVIALAHAGSVLRSADDERVKVTAGLLAAAVAAQIGLGIWTLLALVPLPLALLHQAGALAVFAAAIMHLHGLSADARR